MTKPKTHIALFASGGGTNAQAIIDACANGTLDADVVCMIGNNSKAGCFERARKAGIPTVHISGVTHPDPKENDRATLEALQKYEADLICLAGYMKKLGHETLATFRGRAFNIHPGLLPSHGGLSMYGEAVHAAVLAAGDSESGPTVHLVTDEYDEGPVLAQTRVPVLPDDDVKSLAARVLVQEHLLYVDTIQKVIDGRIDPRALLNKA